MRGARRTRPAGKAKGRATEERVNMKAKEEDLATKGNTQRRERERRSGSEWRLTWGAAGSHPQAMSDPRKKKETRGLRWADCNDEEGKENEEGGWATGDDG